MYLRNFLIEECLRITNNYFFGRIKNNFTIVENIYLFYFSFINLSHGKNLSMKLLL